MAISPETKAALDALRAEQPWQRYGCPGLEVHDSLVRKLIALAEFDPDEFADLDGRDLVLTTP